MSAGFYVVHLARGRTEAHFLGDDGPWTVHADERVMFDSPGAAQAALWASIQEHGDKDGFRGWFDESLARIVNKETECVHA